jgi:hypothetical protein
MKLIRKLLKGTVPVIIESHCLIGKIWILSKRIKAVTSIKAKITDHLNKSSKS